MDSFFYKKRILLFIIISIAYLVVFFQRVAPAVVGPVMADELGLMATDIGIMASMYFWAQAMGCLPAGLLSDTIGPRKIISYGLILATIGTIIFVQGSEIFILALGRFIIGLGVSVVFVGALKIFSEWFYPNELGTCSGMLLAVGNVGALISTAPLMFLITLIGWRNSFWIVAAYTIMASALAYLILRNKPQECGFPPLTNSTTKNVSMGTAMKSVFGLRNFYTVFIAGSLYYGTLIAVGGLWAGPYLQDVYGLSKDIASSVVMCFTIGMVVGAPISGYLSDKIIKSRKNVVLLGMLTHIIVYIPLVWLIDSMALGMLYILFTAFGITGSFIIICFACAKEVAEPCYAATAVGAQNMGMAAGAGFFQYICGLIIDSYGKSNGVYGQEAYASAFTLCMCMMAIAIVIMLFFKENKIK